MIHLWLSSQQEPEELVFRVPRQTLVYLNAPGGNVVSKNRFLSQALSASRFTEEGKVRDEANGSDTCLW
jgi:hypothetical protein